MDDIKLEFPNSKGFSTRNLKYMKKFTETFEDFTIVQAVLAQLTWYHHIALMDKIKKYDEYDSFFHLKEQDQHYIIRRGI